MTKKEQLETKAREMWREEWGEIPDGPLYGTGETLEDRWESLSEHDRDYYRGCVRDDLGWKGLV